MQVLQGVSKTVRGHIEREQRWHRTEEIGSPAFLPSHLLGQKEHSKNEV